MDQIITLLTNLFNLTKVASLTLPGLLTAGGLALILWPAMPIDVIPVVTNVNMLASMNAPTQPPTPQQSTDSSKDDKKSARECPPTLPCYMKFIEGSNFPPAAKEACTVEHPQVGKFILWIARPGSEGCPVTEESWCSQGSKNVQKRELVSGVEPLINEGLPRGRQRKIAEQFVLDVESRQIAACIDQEKSWQGQEEKDVTQLSADADILEKQRSAAQDSYLAYLKTNDRELVGRYKSEMAELQWQIVALRGMIRSKNFDADQRALRLMKLTEDQRLIADRLGDPGRLRPRVGFDVFVSGLVTQVVAFILLSLAAAIVVTAFDRAAFGAFFEDLFDGL